MHLIQILVLVLLFLLDNSEIVTGNNQENASYPSGLCAERTAIYYAGAQYPDAKILKMAIISRFKNKSNNNSNSTMWCL